MEEGDTSKLLFIDMNAWGWGAIQENLGCAAALHFALQTPAALLASKTVLSPLRHKKKQIGLGSGRMDIFWGMFVHSLINWTCVCLSVHAS